jgi:hypothetical protein
VHFAAHLVAVDGGAFQAEDELGRVLGADHQALPHLVARQRIQQRHQGVVDLDQVLVTHRKASGVADAGPGQRSSGGGSTPFCFKPRLQAHRPTQGEHQC